MLKTYLIATGNTHHVYTKKLNVFFFNHIKVEILLKVYTWLKHYYGIVYGKKRSWTDGWINE